MVGAVEEKLTDGTTGPGEVTVTLHVAYLVSSDFEVQVIVAVPAATAVTVPSDTVATDESLVVHKTLLSVAVSGNTVAINVLVPPSSSVREFWSRLTDSTGTSDEDTVTLHVAYFDESYTEVQVIVAVPTATAVTVPFDTVATDESLVVHETLLSVAVDGNTVAVKVSVPPTVSAIAAVFRTTESTGTTDTVTLHDADFAGLDFEVQVIVADPSATAVTVPSSTVATDESLVVHVTLLSVAISGNTVAVKVSVPPTVSEREL